MKTLLFGRNGMLGSSFIKYADISKAVDIDECDISNRESVFKLVSEYKPQLIINCAALSDVDYCEKHEEEAWAVNYHAVKNISDAARSVGAFFVTYSSDAAISPVNVYGRTKEAVEKSIDALVIRLTYLYNENHWIVKDLSQGKPLTLYTNVTLNPISVYGLVNTTLALVDKGYRGIINVGTEAPVSMHRLGISLAKAFDLDSSMISEGLLKNGSGTRRNTDRYLDISELRRMLPVYTLEEDLARFRSALGKDKK